MLSTSTYCSDRNPQPGCSAVKGICKPMDHSTLGVYRNLQNQINRVLSAQGKRTIGVDGRIGPGTVKALNSAMGTGYDVCDKVAVFADNLASSVKAKADSLGAPIQVASPKPPSPPSLPAPGGAVSHPANIQEAGFIGFIKSPVGIATAIGTIAALYWIGKRS